MAGLTNWLSQTASVVKLGLETIVERKGASAAAVFGIAGVVAVLVATLSIAQGFRRAMVASGDPGTAVVLRSGSDTELMSIFGYEATRIIADAPGIARSDGGPLASPKLFVIIDRSKRNTGTDANVPLREGLTRLLSPLGMYFAVEDDHAPLGPRQRQAEPERRGAAHEPDAAHREIGRASCRERV